MCRYVHEEWKMGATLCRLYPFFFYGNVGASLMSMVAITINRYNTLPKYNETFSCYKMKKVHMLFLTYKTEKCLSTGRMLVFIPRFYHRLVELVEIPVFFNPGYSETGNILGILQRRGAASFIARLRLRQLMFRLWIISFKEIGAIFSSVFL
jgi:hypothetical protein